MPFSHDCTFKVGQEVRIRGEVDVYFVQGIEAKVSNMGYFYYLIYCESLESGEKKTFREWELVSNLPDEEEKEEAKSKKGKKK